MSKQTEDLIDEFADFAKSVARVAESINEFSKGLEYYWDEAEREQIKRRILLQKRNTLGLTYLEKQRLEGLS